MRVATFNGRHGVGRRGWADTHGLVATCRALDADVLALQELDRRVVRSWFRDQPAVVARALGMRAAVGRARRTPVGGHQCNALLARGTLADVVVDRLPRRPGHEQRIAVTARVTLPGGALTVASTHLQHRGGRAAAEQLHALLEIVAARPAPTVVAGDFNLGPDVVGPILADHGFAPVPSGPTYPARGPRRRIDFVAVAGLHVLETRVIRPDVSDHCALVADLAFA